MDEQQNRWVAPDYPSSLYAVLKLASISPKTPQRRSRLRGVVAERPSSDAQSTPAYKSTTILIAATRISAAISTMTAQNS